MCPLRLQWGDLHWHHIVESVQLTDENFYKETLLSGKRGNWFIKFYTNVIVYISLYYSGAPRARSWLPSGSTLQIRMRGRWTSERCHLDSLLRIGECYGEQWIDPAFRRYKLPHADLHCRCMRLKCAIPRRTSTWSMKARISWTPCRSSSRRRRIQGSY